MEQLGLWPPPTGVVLDEGQIHTLLSGIGSPTDTLWAIDFLQKAGWSGAEEARHTAVQRFLTTGPTWDDLCLVVDQLGRRAPQPLIVLLIEMAAEKGHFHVLRAEWFDCDRLAELPRGLLQHFLETAIDQAVLDLHPGRIFGSPHDGDAFPCLPSLLTEVAPLVYRDPVDRLAWFLGRFCERVAYIPEEDRWLATDPVTEWFPSDLDALGRFVALLAGGTEAWLGVLNDEYFEGSLFHARRALGLEGEEEED